MKRTTYCIMAAALLTAGALLTTACSNEDDAAIENTTPSVGSETIQFTATLAPKGDDGTTTRAITTGKDGENKEILNVKWNANEQIFIYYETTDGHASTTATVQSVDETTGVATITATFAANAKDNGDAKFVYPSTLATATGDLDEGILLNNQNGLLRTGTTNISKNFDAATQTGKISVSGGTASVKGTVAMENRVCICKITLGFSNDGTNISSELSAGKTITITVGDGRIYTISSPFEAADQPVGGPTVYRAFKSNDIIYVAMLPVTSQPVVFLSTTDGGTTYASKMTGTLAAGKFYRNVSVKISRGKDLSTGSITAADGDIIYSSAASSNSITIPDGYTVTLAGVNISSSGSAGIICNGTANIILAGTNTVTAPNSYPGIQAGGSGTLTISGGGSLTATGGNYGAGIGSSNSGTCGDITISGGTIIATGGSSGAGIGSSELGTCGDITISGGIITANGGNNSAGIGSGGCAHCGNINISGGNVTATKGSIALYSIGKGNDNSTYPSTCGTITIGGTNYGTDGITTSPFTWPTP